VIDWKEVARHYRWLLRLAERHEIDLKRQLWVERDRSCRLSKRLQEAHGLQPEVGRPVELLDVRPTDV
jgi:hypothetical protein